MLDEARRKLVVGDLPQFFEADSVLLGLARGIETIACDGLLRKGAPGALREEHVLAAQLHAAGEPRLWLAVTAYPHIAGRDAQDLAFVAEQELRRREAGVDFDPERLRAGAEPAHDRAQRTDEIAVVAHELRHRPIGQFDASAYGEKIELIGCDLGLERAFRIGPPVGREAVKPDRIDHRSRKNVRAYG